jgi:hypothetical protein
MNGETLTMKLMKRVKYGTQELRNLRFRRLLCM